METKQIEFKVQRQNPITGKLEWEVPRWREAEAVNVKCPLDSTVMVAVNGDPLYSWCPKCKKYFLAE